MPVCGIRCIICGIYFCHFNYPPPLTVSAETQAEIKIPVISWKHLGENSFQFTLENTMDGFVYRVYQVFEGNMYGDGDFLNKEEVRYGQSYGTQGELVPVETVETMLADRDAYSRSIKNDLKNPLAELTHSDNSITVPGGFYVVAMDFAEGGGGADIPIISNPPKDLPVVSADMINGTYSLTVKDAVPGHTYHVYQIFSGRVGSTDEGINLSDVKYGSSYGTEGEKVPDDVLSGITDAKEFAKKIKNDLHGDPIASLTAENPKADLPAGYYLVIDSGSTGAENDAVSDFVVAVAGTTTFTPKAVTVPEFDKAMIVNETSPGFLRIPDGTEIIGEVLDRNSETPWTQKGIYQNNTEIETVYIPKSVKTIGYKAFAGCTNLKSVIFEEGSQLKHIEPYAFSETGIVNIKIPKTVQTDNLSDLEDNWGEWFFRCENLKKVVFEKGSILTKIPYRAFYECKNLEMVCIPDSVTSIDRFAFNYCDNLKAVYIPDSVTDIDYAILMDSPNASIYCGASAQKPGYKVFNNETYNPMICSWNHHSQWASGKLPTSYSITKEKFYELTGYTDELPASEDLGSTSLKDTTICYGKGDTVPFELTAKLPDSVSSYDSYSISFHDTLSSGFDFDESSIRVTADGTEIAPENYTVQRNGNEFSVSIADVKATPYSLQAGQKVKVSYSAVLNEGTVFGNVNRAYLEYSNDPNSDGKGRTTADDVTAFTFTLQFEKTDKDGNPLSGAGFTLYKEDGKTSVPVGSEITGSTSFTFDGLPEGSYRLAETTTPDGYNTMEDLWFKIVAESTEDAAGNASVTSLRITGEDGADLSGWTVSKETGTISSDIVNYSGSQLPSTGGIGTYMFYIAGSAVMIIVGVIITAKKKEHE